MSDRVVGIGGIFFKARDPARLRAWYRDHLGPAIGDCDTRCGVAGFTSLGSAIQFAPLGQRCRSVLVFASAVCIPAR